MDSSKAADPSPTLSMVDLVSKVNQFLPFNSMWDGFWVHAFKRSNLVIGAAFDRSLGRDFDIVFKKVIFFNLPARWSDSHVVGGQLVRLATQQEFALQQPDFDTQNLSIFAFDISWGCPLGERLFYTYYVVAKSIWAFKCEGDDRQYGGAEFTDPWAVGGNPRLIDGKPCLLNRVTRPVERSRRSQAR
jgi:hypothetical protein